MLHWMLPTWPLGRLWSIFDVFSFPVLTLEDKQIAGVEVGEAGKEVSSAFQNLLVVGGAGTWPPSPTFVDTWPQALRGYDTVALEIAPHIPVLVSCLDDAENRKTINAMRARTEQKLSQYVEIEKVLEALEDNNWSASEISTQAAWMGFSSCIAFLRHAYRWGVSPVVREAQNESSGIIFPEALCIPWEAIQQRFGFTGPSGSVSTNLYFAVDATDHHVYSSTVGLPETHRRTEYWNGLLMLEMERKALPMYQAMVDISIALEQGDIDCAVASTKQASDLLKITFRFFHENLINANVSHELWMAYAQGFHGWAHEGFDGVSGGQVLIIRTLDAFLGIRPWPEPDVEAQHLPQAQRDWLNALRTYDIRSRAKSRRLNELSQELERMVAQLRVWRMSHMKRMQYYEGVPRPERRHMTAGKSLAPEELAPDEIRMVQYLKGLLSKRLSETK